MFEYLYSHYDMPGFFRLFSYVTFRALMASLCAMTICFVCGNWVICRLHRLNFRESISGDGPSSHQAKQGTPTMGGILILGSLGIACLLFGNLYNFYFVLLLVNALLFGSIGFVDDYAKSVLNKKNGLSVRLKFSLTLMLALGSCLTYYYCAPTQEINPKVIHYDITGLFLPFLKVQFYQLPLALALFFWLIVLIGSSHAVNLTDGLDGLAIGNVSIVAVTMGLLAYITGTPLSANYLNLPTVQGAHELAVFFAALTGAGVGFLWFNAAPARVFMGDTGSLALGSSLGLAAIILKKEVLLIVAGGVFVMEASSVILQVISYKLWKKRIFKMAPLHHHFELCGWPETHVVIRFWLLGLILSLMSLSTLRIQ